MEVDDRVDNADSIIIKARQYQQNIIDVCIKKNSLVFLPTGSGKSYIAISVIRYFSDQLQKKYSEGGKRSFFLVNTIALAKQQTTEISKHLPFEVGILTGEQNVDAFSSDVWARILDENEIFVMTAQCFADAINHSFIKLNQVNVLIFDECHNGKKDHAYNRIMKKIKPGSDDSKNIRIIGLSGMLIGQNDSTKPGTVSKELIEIESIFQSTIITVNNIDDRKNVLIYSTKPKELYTKFTKTLPQGCIQKVVSILNEFSEQLASIKLDNTKTINPKNLREGGPKKINDIIKLFKDFEYQVEEMGNYGSYLTLLSINIQLELTKRYADTELYRKFINTCITKVEFCINQLQRNLQLNTMNYLEIYNNSSKKVQCLLGTLEKLFKASSNKDLQCLIFVERRTSSKALYHVIKAYANSKNLCINPDFMVGYNNDMPESIEAILSRSFNSLALEKFKNKETNCIVCTSVLEEGIDLRLCSLVIMYDYPKTLRSYAQSRGRARDAESKYILLIEEDSIPKFFKKKSVWKSVEEVMKKELIGKTIDRDAPDDFNIKKEQEEKWEPFVTKNGASLTPVNCIPTLNHYIMTLTSGFFSNTGSIYRRIDNSDKTVTVEITLPPQSMIYHGILGEAHRDVKFAKRHAAFKACIELYQCGNLNDNLTPIEDSEKIEELHDEYFSHWNKYEGDKKKKAGTRNNRRIHKIKIPKALTDCAPTVTNTNFLYVITFKPKFDCSNNESLQSFFELIENGNTYGILTSKRIPKLCSVPLYQSYGEIECEIAELPFPVSLKNEADLEKLRKFHCTIFRDVLKVFKNFLIIDKTSYIIVPIEDNEINWKLINQSKLLPKPIPLTYEQIKSMEFREQDYLYSVINPVYREINNDATYVVTKVLVKDSPLTPFPDENRENYENFKSYFEGKYRLPIHRSDQFLVEVKGISKNLNLFFPASGMSNKQKIRQNMKEIYIPELCHNYMFPADYWLKATFLPSFFQRIHYLLLAEELRNWLLREKIDKGNGEQIYQLDVFYNNIDSREKFLLDEEKLFESHGKLEGFSKNFKSNDEEEKVSELRTKALLMFEKSSLPIDIDRNWSTVTATDIAYYYNFINQNQNKTVSEKLPRSYLNKSKIDFALKDAEYRDCIELLRLDNLKYSVQQKDLIKVLTTSNAGDIFDMERYEMLGDSFLKFITSLYLFKKYDKWHEGYLTTLKGKLVSNRNLFYIGNDFGLSQMIKVSKFCEGHKLLSLAPSAILPENLMSTLSGNRALLKYLLDINEHNYEAICENIERVRQNEHTTSEFKDECDQIDTTLLPYLNEQSVSDKVVADCVESFIGCVISSIGIASGLDLCQKIHILPKNEDLQGLLTENIPPRFLINTANPNKITYQKLLEKIIGYEFKNSAYLKKALTHASYPIQDAGSYEELEFLGDAILDFLITSYIYEQCPRMDPGKLTDLRSALVNNETLASITVRCNIQKFLLAENQHLFETIQKFVSFQESQNFNTNFDKIILLNTEEDTSVAESVDIPKVLGDVFESIVGAVFLDSNLSLEITWKVIYGLMKIEIHEFMANVPLQIIRRLFEFKKGIAQPQFYDTEVMENEGYVAVPLKVICNNEQKVFVGFGSNRELAKKAAAKKALIQLTKNSS